MSHLIFRNREELPTVRRERVNARLSHFDNSKPSNHSNSPNVSDPSTTTSKTSKTSKLQPPPFQI
ncbi:hypothetical protein M378DRAFT_542557 [Amanita muscaria Koide BX008]|uniref:Uncharacterized protein n=1 Tax=Amanita muscaria (strain Koide BX008) TaxID=946122 RepID=A0A0C2SPF1_AMAMK|nr:hypothetical protein M378DRAFT_542557 [Amanita muscaria Koide BX008]